MRVDGYFFFLALLVSAALSLYACLLARALRVRMAALEERLRAPHGAPGDSRVGDALGEDLNKLRWDVLRLAKEGMDFVHEFALAVDDAAASRLIRERKGRLERRWRLGALTSPLKKVRVDAARWLIANPSRHDAKAIEEALKTSSSDPESRELIHSALTSARVEEGASGTSVP